MRLTALRANNLRTIRQAGPRYAPGLDPASPNLTIASLISAFETIGLTAAFRLNVRGLRIEFETASRKASRAIIQGFRGHVHTPTLLCARLAELESASPQEAIEVWRGIEVTAKRSNAIVQRISDRAANAVRLSPAESPDQRRKIARLGGLATRGRRKRRRKEQPAGELQFPAPRRLRLTEDD